MKENTINYQKRFSRGTCYSQTINISEKTFDKLMDIRRTEFIIPKWILDELGEVDYYKNTFLKSEIIREGDFIFLNLTQRDFFNQYLKLNLKDRNTCLRIIK